MALRDIRLLVLDVDGVLTDGGIAVHADGSQSVTFHVRDGAGIKYLQRAGIEVAILSGRSIPAVEHRARELGIQDILQGHLAKVSTWETLLKKHGLRDAQAAYMGDDLADVPLLRRAGWSAAPADATEDARNAARFVTRAAGGRGAVREASEKILRARGLWDGIRETWGALPR
ncbi:MAG: HAD-IIIA family hydrolase [Candidatus Brocadiae bacterium]|nr:HAD-IIIA family hydrolase [Candidatus Brocadiia bacterium]